MPPVGAYFIGGSNKEADMASRAKTTQELWNKYSNMFTAIQWFKDTFSLLVKEGAKQHQTLTRLVAYMLEEAFKKEWKDYKNNK